MVSVHGPVYRTFWKRLGVRAARTDRVALGVGCMASMPLRDALLMAYQWLSFDYLSGGRSIFVACQGQREAGGGKFAEEFASFGIDPSTRSRRMEESIEILRSVSMTEHASYEGTYNRFEDVTVLPRPVQQPLPIGVTANPNPAFPRLAERTLRRVARLGDGWMTTANTPDSLAANLATIQRYATEEGRPLGDRFEACLYYNIHVTEDADRGMDEVASYLRDYRCNRTGRRTGTTGWQPLRASRPSPPGWFPPRCCRTGCSATGSGWV